MVSEPKWTPGPWTVQGPSLKVFDAGLDVHIADTRGWGCFTGKGHGAMGFDDAQAVEIMRANADLIAAAPDLYEALEELVAIINSAGLHNLTNGVPLGQTSWYVKASDRLQWAGNALAKARGET